MNWEHNNNIITLPEMKKKTKQINGTWESSNIGETKTLQQKQKHAREIEGRKKCNENEKSINN